MTTTAHSGSETVVAVGRGSEPNEAAARLAWVAGASLNGLWRRLTMLQQSEHPSPMLRVVAIQGPSAVAELVLVFRRELVNQRCLVLVRRVSRSVFR